MNKVKMRVVGQPVRMTVSPATIVYGDGATPPYTGPYDVTPKTEAQTLKTAHKRMTDDVEVRAIPFFETSNTAGGETVYIAMEV